MICGNSVPRPSLLLSNPLSLAAKSKRGPHGTRLVKHRMCNTILCIWIQSAWLIIHEIIMIIANNYKGDNERLCSSNKVDVST